AVHRTRGPRRRRGAWRGAGGVPGGGGGPGPERAISASPAARRTNRRTFDGRGLFAQNRVQILAQAPDGVRLHWIDDAAAIGGIADLAHDATHEQVTNHRLQAEPFAWMRFGDEARRPGDGVPVDALELSTVARFLPHPHFDP